MAKRNAFYAQSGGVTAVINATASAVIQTARRRKVKVLAAKNGILQNGRIFAQRWKPDHLDFISGFHPQRLVRKSHYVLRTVSNEEGVAKLLECDNAMHSDPLAFNHIRRKLKQSVGAAQRELSESVWRCFLDENVLELLYVNDHAGQLSFTVKGRCAGTAKTHS